MNYKSWPDEDLRRVLLTDPDDTIAICEAAERFAKGEDPEESVEEAYSRGYEEGRKDAGDANEVCSECGGDLA